MLTTSELKMKNKCLKCKKEFKPSKYNSYKNGRTRQKYCSKKCKDIDYHKIYDSQANNKKIHLIRCRDRYKLRNIKKVCEECGSEENVQIHHITYDLENNYTKILCANCHKKLHRSII